MKITCYMLRVEPKDTHTAIIMAKRGAEAAPCGDKPWHRAELPVDESTSFDDVRDRLLPVRCMYCGQHEFTKHNCEITFSHSESIYINPTTHVISSNVRVAAAPGAMWYCPWLVEDGGVSGVLSEEYLRDWAGKRPPIAVMLPGGHEWVIDQCAQNKRTGWAVSGIAPSLTAYPSIVTPSYHGWLRDGILSPA